MTEITPTTMQMNPAFRWVNIFTLIVVMLTAITWIVGVIQPGRSAPEEIAFVNGFPGDISQWTRRGDDDAIVFSEDGVFVQRRTAKQPYATRLFNLPTTAQQANYFLEVEGLVHTATDVEAKKAAEGDGIQMGVLMAWFHGEDGEVIQYRTVHDLHLEESIHKARRSLEIPDGATAFSIAVGTRDSVEGYKLVEANAQLVEVTVATKFIYYSLLAAWAIVLLIALWWVLKTSTLLHGIAIIGTLAALAIGVLLPESVTFKFLSSVRLYFFDSQYGANSQMLMPLIFKAGHFLVFAIAAFFLFSRRVALGIRGPSLLLLLIVLALGTEGLQLQLPDRTTRASDVILDVVGIMVGVGAAYIINRMTRPKIVDTQIESI